MRKIPQVIMLFAGIQLDALVAQATLVVKAGELLPHLLRRQPPTVCCAKLGEMAEMGAFTIRAMRLIHNEVHRLLLSHAREAPYPKINLVGHRSVAEQKLPLDQHPVALDAQPPVEQHVILRH
jgi:hypothetical protein